jgi:hypothetical protein
MGCDCWALNKISESGESAESDSAALVTETSSFPFDINWLCGFGIKQNKRMRELAEWSGVGRGSESESGAKTKWACKFMASFSHFSGNCVIPAFAAWLA